MWEPAPTRRDCTLLLPLLAPPSPLVQGVELPGLGLTALREDESQREAGPGEQAVRGEPEGWEAAE